DADLLVRPVPGANHIAWQLGHLIASEHHMISKSVPGADLPALPAGFSEQHGKETASKDTGFRTKAEYLDLFGKMRKASIGGVAKRPGAAPDRPPGGEFAPPVGAMLLLGPSHPTMHVGQFPVVRRKLGKPVLF